MLETPAIDVLRELLERQLQAIERSQAGVRDGADPEDLHRFRVATRRTRALIRASRPLIRDQLAGLDRELRWLGGVSGPVRDLDVLIDHIRDLVDDLEPDQAGAESIIAGLERERLTQRRGITNPDGPLRDAPRVRQLDRWRGDNRRPSDCASEPAALRAGRQ